MSRRVNRDPRKLARYRAELDERRQAAARAAGYRCWWTMQDALRRERDLEGLRELAAREACASDPAP